MRKRRAFNIFWGLPLISLKLKNYKEKQNMYASSVVSIFVATLEPPRRISTEYLSTMLIKLNGFWIAQIPWSLSLQIFFPYYTCWVVYFIFLRILENKNAWVLFFPFLYLITNAQHKLHWQLNKPFNREEGKA